MNNLNAIGIVGGVGPLAGVDLFERIVGHTKANKDQDHISVIMTSCPEIIPDRTGFLLSGGDDPAPGIQRCMEILASSGAKAIGLCCNTAHSPKIVGRVNVPEGVTFVNMIDSTCTYLASHVQGKVGLIATLGTIRTGIYAQYFSSYPDLELVVPDDETCNMVHNAIYDKEYGIKANPCVTLRAREDVFEAVRRLYRAGCKAVILGCTELPLVFNNVQSPVSDILYANPTDILAVELIKAVAPEKLK